jgi:hypothetical protein
MTEQFEKMKRGYRDIKAPRGLADQVRTAVAGQPEQRHFWVPAAAATVAVAAILWILPSGVQKQGAVDQTPARPSLSALASLTLTKPPGAAPSLSQLRSVKVPRLPDKPRPAEPPTKSQIETEVIKEKAYALI